MIRNALLGGILTLLMLTAGAANAAEGTDWAIDADTAESCSCSVACPCLFGSPPTNSACQGSRLFHINKGSYGDVRLDGLNVIATFDAGIWVRYYVDESATDEQLAAVAPLLRKVAPVFTAETLSVERAPLSIERSKNRVKYSAPNARVEIERTLGINGKSITIANLSTPDLANYVQFTTVENIHVDSERGFAHTETNGFTSTVEMSGRTGDPTGDLADEANTESTAHDH